MTRINGGEQVVTSVVQFGELCNILEDQLSLGEAIRIERALCFRENVGLIEVSHQDYLAALDEAERHEVGLNDALAHVVMQRSGIGELYSFDGDFDRFRDVKRVTA